jgi:hypothetical protein
MSERPTPETDAAVWMTGEPWDEKDEVVCSNLARKLERERDEAREQIAKLRAELVQLKEVAQ